MWREYADAFVGADVVVLTDIYPSGTTPIPGVTGRADRQRRARRPSPTPAWCGCRAATTWCRSSPARSAAGDVCISMGCGDIATLPEEILARRALLRSAS